MQQGLHTTLSGWAHGILHGILPILDLRTPDRYLQERLVGAANVPAGDLSGEMAAQVLLGYPAS
jgi:rhodanese-related sulfurtransferase